MIKFVRIKFLSDFCVPHHNLKKEYYPIAVLKCYNTALSFKILQSRWLPYFRLMQLEGTDNIHYSGVLFINFAKKVIQKLSRTARRHVKSSVNTKH